MHIMWSMPAYACRTCALHRRRLNYNITKFIGLLFLVSLARLTSECVMQIHLFQTTSKSQSRSFLTEIGRRCRRRLAAHAGRMRWKSIWPILRSPRFAAILPPQSLKRWVIYGRSLIYFIDMRFMLNVLKWLYAFHVVVFLLLSASQR